MLSTNRHEFGRSGQLERHSSLQPDTLRKCRRIAAGVRDPDRKAGEKKKPPQKKPPINNKRKKKKKKPPPPPPPTHPTWQWNLRREDFGCVEPPAPELVHGCHVEERRKAGAGRPRLNPNLGFVGVWKILTMEMYHLLHKMQRPVQRSPPRGAGPQPQNGEIYRPDSVRTAFSVYLCRIFWEAGFRSVRPPQINVHLVPLRERGWNYAVARCASKEEFG